MNPSSDSHGSEQGFPAAPIWLADESPLNDSDEAESEIEQGEHELSEVAKDHLDKLPPPPDPIPDPGPM